METMKAAVFEGHEKIQLEKPHARVKDAYMSCESRVGLCTSNSPHKVQHGVQSGVERFRLAEARRPWPSTWQ